MGRPGDSAFPFPLSLPLIRLACISGATGGLFRRALPLPRTRVGRARLTTSGAQVEAGVFRNPRLNLGAPDAQFRCADAITALLADDIEFMWAAVPIEYVPGKEHLGIQMVLGHRAGERILEGEGGPSHDIRPDLLLEGSSRPFGPRSGVPPLLFSRAPSRAGGVEASGSLPSMRSRM